MYIYVWIRARLQLPTKARRGCLIALELGLQAVVSHLHRPNSGLLEE